MLHTASWRIDLNPGWLISAVTIAQVRGGPLMPGFWHSGPFDSLKLLVLPAFTPPTRRSPPFVRPNALSNATLNVLPELPPLAPVSTTAATPAPTRLRAAAIRR